MRYLSSLVYQLVSQHAVLLVVFNGILIDPEKVAEESLHVWVAGILEFVLHSAYIHLVWYNLFVVHHLLDRKKAIDNYNGEMSRGNIDNVHEPLGMPLTYSTILVKLVDTCNQCHL